MAEFWEETIKVLQPAGSSQQLVTKPHLKPELLQKIPFKFLHDVIVAVLKKTKFAPGIFTKEEMDRKWEGYDKDAVGKETANQNKRKFLADILGVVSCALNEPVSCDVREVVKGRDAIGANKLLQMLAKAADVLQLDGVEALRVHRSRGEAQAETAAMRPESRRAHKPPAVPSATDQPMELGVQQEVRSQASIPTADQQKGATSGLDDTTDHPEVSGAPDVRSASYMDGSMHTSELAAAFSDVERPAAAAGASEVSSPPPTSQELKNRPSALVDSESTLVGGELGPGNNVETPSHVASPAPQRPMTAKKPPPPVVSPAPEPQRGRLPPQGMVVGTSGPRQSVHLYKEELSTEDDSLYVVDSSVQGTVQKEQESHGKLVSEMFKVIGSVEVAQGAAPQDDESLDSGINLGRSKRLKKQGSIRIDISSIRDAVEALVQNIAPLARSMDYLQEDKENMQKELQIWRTEGQKWGQELTEELAQTKADSDNQEVLHLDEEIAKMIMHIRQLKRQITQNEERIMNVMNLTVGDE